MKRDRFVRMTALASMTAWTLLVPSMARSAPLVANFEDLPLSSESSWNGTDDTYDNSVGQYNTFQSGGATFYNYHEHATYQGWEYHYWDGWGYSNKSDIGSSGFSGEFTAMGSGLAGQNGAGNSANYGVAFAGWDSFPTVTFTTPVRVLGAYFTNTAWAYYTMRDGDPYGFAKKFGGPSGNDPDWFKLTITGKDATGTVTGTLDFYLADFRFEDNAQDYIVNNWTFVDLTSLGVNVKSLEFAISSSDVGEWGMNTPAYFAMDDLSFVPEPATVAMLAAGLAVGWGTYWWCGKKKGRRTNDECRMSNVEGRILRADIGCIRLAAAFVPRLDDEDKREGRSL